MNKIPDHILRRIAQDQFRNCNNSPGSWGLSAHRLYTASLPIAAMISEAEERKFKRMETRAPGNGSYQLSDEETQDMWIGQTSAVWSMLIGLAFENLLKGIIIGREGLTVQSNGELPLKKTHKLGELAKRADFGGVDDYELFEFYYH